MKDDNSIHSKLHCGIKNRKLFSILIITMSLFIVYWTYNIPYHVGSLGNNILIRNMSLKFPFKSPNINIIPVRVTGPQSSNMSTYNETSPNETSTHVTPSHNTPINPHDYKYVILEKDVCSGSVFLMVVVCAAPANFKQRVTIRETWGSVVKTNKEIRLIFMIGKTSDDKIQNQIKNESHKYHDIVQEDFLDSYRNLTLKSVALLKWSLKYCPSSKYTVKVDDDMFINLEYLFAVLKHRTLKNTVIGMKIVGAAPIQDKSSKWYTPTKMFNGRFYPTYCSGGSYVISGDAREKLYNTSLATPFFVWEDVYITGMCRIKAKVDNFNDNRFAGEKLTSSGCTFRKGITGHQYNESELRKIWGELKDSSLKCDVTNQP